MNEEMSRAIEKISSLVGNYGTAPEVRSVVLRMVEQGTAEPAMIKSVAVGLELALDIMKREANNESPGKR